jgi:ABC-2 type transport system permease protein
VAELSGGKASPSSAQDIPMRVQLLAVAWLRWRIFINSMFRGRMVGAGNAASGRQVVGLVFAILLRIIVWPFFALMVIGPIGGSGFFAWVAIAQDHPQRLAPLLAAITVLWIFVSINGQNVAAVASNFDPSSLARFPLRFGRYLVLRTLIGLLTPSTIVGCLALLAAAVGIGIAKHSLALPALVVLSVYALMNIFLMRMIGAWLERWLANRRFREIFGALMALSVIGFQFLNFQRAPGRAPGGRSSLALNILHSSGAGLQWLPPGFAANTILQLAHPFAALAQFAALLASAALFAAVFATRMHKQFLGEYLSEGASRGANERSGRRSQLRSEVPGRAVTASQTQDAQPGFPPIVAACLHKEWLTLRGNGVQLIGMLTPLVFVVILNRSIFAGHSTYFLPGAIAYVLFGVLAGLYNIFGADGLGVQLYLLAPIRLRDVIVAKNLMSLTVIVAEAGLAWLLVSMLTRTPIPLATQISTGLWTVFVIGANLALGTMRSIQAPRRFVPGQTQRRRVTPTNRTSGLLILLVLFGSMALQFPVTILCRYFDDPWLGVWIFGPLAFAAITAYALLLRNADRLILAHRDIFAEELCKL